MKKKIKKVWKTIAPIIIPTYGYSKTLVQSGLYKLHSKGFRGQKIRVLNIGPGLEKNPFLSEMENRIRRVSVIDDKPYEGQVDNATGINTYHDNMMAQLFLTYIPKIGGCPFLERYTVVKVKDIGGSWSPDGLSKALDYILNLPIEERPHLVSMSFGISADWNIDTTEYSFNQCKIKFERIKALGIRCFASSGNKGLSTPDWPGILLDTVGCKMFNEQRHFNSNKAKWIYYGHAVDVFDVNSKPTKVELSSYACPQLVAAIATYLGMKVVQGYDVWEVLKGLEEYLRYDKYLVETLDGLSLKF